MESIYKIESQEVRQTLQEERTDILVKHEKFLLENAFRVSFRMNSNQLEQLQDCFEDRYVISEKATKDSAHPILSGLNQYANMYCQNAIKALTGKGIICITFGDAADGPLGAAHNCLLVADPREYQRIGLNSKASSNLKEYVRGKNVRPCYCTHGGQNCYFQAEEAFAVHSLYDVSMADLCKMFENHGLNKLTAFLHITTKLYGPDYVDPFPFFNAEVGKDYVIFNMCDTSIPYVHNLENYRAWATTTIVKYRHFDLVFEHARTFGPMHLITVTRIKHDVVSPLQRLLRQMTMSPERQPDAIRMTVPLSKIFKNAYLIPDMYHALANKFLYKQQDTKHYVVPQNIVIALFAYANRASDEGYKYHELATYASGLRRRIVIGGVQYQTSWECDANVYNRVLFSMFILGAVSRSDRTKGISAVFSHLKNTGMESSFLGDLFRSVHRFFHTKTEKDPNALGDRIWEFKAIPITDISICNVVKINNKDRIYKDAGKSKFVSLECDDSDEDDTRSTTSRSSNNSKDHHITFNSDLTPSSFRRFSVSSSSTSTSSGSGDGLLTLDLNTSIESAAFPDIPSCSVADDTSIVFPTIPDHDPSSAAGRRDHRTPVLVSILDSDQPPSIDASKVLEPTTVDSVSQVDNTDGQKPINLNPDTKEAVPDGHKPNATINPVFKVDNTDGQKPVHLKPSIKEDVLDDQKPNATGKSIAQPDRQLLTPPAELNILDSIMMIDEDDTLYNNYFTSTIDLLPKRSLDDQTKGLPKYRVNNYRALIENEAQRYKKYFRSDKLNYIADNLFNAPKDVPLAHCVAADFHMSGGIALTFKEVYGNVDKLTAQKKQVGENALLRSDRRIYYMVTKSRTVDKPTYQALERCLDNLFSDCMKNGSKRIAMPKIGCGIDGLEWGIVSAMISDKFIDHIAVDIYDPSLLAIGYIPKATVSNHSGINGDEPEITTRPSGIVNKVKSAVSKVLSKNHRNTGGFLSGHCAMVSFYEVMPVEKRPKVPDYLEICRALLSNMNYGIMSDSDITSYIDHGIYDNNCSAAIIPLLSSWYSVPILLNVDGKDSPALVYHTDAEGNQFDPNGKYEMIFFANKHYSSRRGGVVQKFDQITSMFDFNEKVVLDISGAPGYLADVIISAGGEVDVGYYTPSPIKYQYEHKTHNYTNFNELLIQIEKNRYDYVISDVARAVNSEAIIYEAADTFVPLLSKGGTFIVKTFGNPHHIFEMACMFSSIRLLPFSSGESERFFALEGYRCGSVTFRDIYDKYNLNITSHTAYHTDLERFTREYFTGEFKTFAPKIPDNVGHIFSFNALTGYASASKTTQAAETYKNAVWISPTKPLSQKHHRLGVPSFTPHTFFSKPKDEYDTIVIDEISQFPIDYLSLVKACYPRHEMVVLGDVHQTGMVNYRNKRILQTVRDVGVINNMLDVYKIPQDVTDMLNRKHLFNINSLSDVSNAITVFAGDIYEFAKSRIPVICFNAETCKKLRSKHLNAYTITTYTGSRDHTVVLYIDSAAVASSLLNRTEQIYTAVTRATNRLVIAGDHGYLTKFYEIHGSNMMIFEEISQAYLFHHSVQPDDENIPITLETGKTSLPVNTDTAMSIIEETIRPVNDQLNEDFSTGVVDIPRVENGSLTTPVDSVVAVQEEVAGYRISFLRASKHQVSNCSLETLQTLVKRYSKRYKVKLDHRNVQMAFTEIMNGLSKALTGSTNNINRLRKMYKITPEELIVRQAAYVDKLQCKINLNPGVVSELQGEYELACEALSFFNKRQTKFDATDGFDMKDKVGQGVAAFSKKVNAVYSAYARMMLDKTREILSVNKRNIILATHDSEAALNDQYTNMITDHPEGLWSCNDFSEWDASFRTPFSKITSMLLEFMGAPNDIIRDFEEYRKSWSMIYRNKHGLTKLRGHEKQFSGNPFTICENTICNMALCFTIFDYKDMKMALFKGDDSAVFCNKCTMSRKGEDIIRLTGHGLKMHNSPVGEFAGWFLTHQGMFPDVLRYAGKFIDKVYRDEKHFNEALMSLQERVVAVKNETQLHAGVAACHYYYKAHFGEERLTIGDIFNLYYFIHNSRRIKFSSLRPVKLPINKV